ncbi:hypothetical protein H0H92_000591 [Tricholoma furcatifolium]|nr:hypothetical protein H0H92_000591 [Tricholoma furcatifolium]
MAATTPTLALEPIDNIDKLKTCIPYLMPFHIDYSGPAPISTYLRVDAAKETVGAPGPEEMNANGSQSTSTGDSQPSITPTESLTNVGGSEGTIDTQTTTPAPLACSSPASRVTDDTTRFISSFRGRTIQGLKVGLPEGYTGVVLREDASGSKARETKGKGTNKRRSLKETGRGARARSKKGQVDDENEFGLDEAMDVDEGEEERKTLTVASQFSNFVLWNADHPVDEGRDEYIRSINEWIQLSHLIHDEGDQ